MMSGVRTGSATIRRLLDISMIVLTSLAIIGYFSQLTQASGSVQINVLAPQPVYPVGSQVVVYARVTMDGSPFSGAVVLWELKDPYGVRKDFGQAVTNATGYATIVIFTSPTWTPGSYTLVAAVSGTDAKDMATITLKAVYISLLVPRNYSLGSQVVVYARVTMDGSPFSGAVVLWELKDPYGVRKDFGQAVTNATGYATIAVASSRDWPLGPYTLIAAVSGTEARATATVYLKRALTRLAVYVTPPSTWRGNNIVVSGYVTLDPTPITYVGKIQVYIGHVLRWTLSLSPTGEFSSPPFNTSGLTSGVHAVRVELLETAEYFGGTNSTTFLIDRVLVTAYSIPEPNRVNAKSTQTIKFQLRYESDNVVFTDVTGNKVWINGTLASYLDGWWYINYTANLGRYVFLVTGIEDNLRTKSDRFWSLITPPSVVWDAICLKNWTILDRDRRVDVNSSQYIYIYAHYWYDKQPLEGSITLNGTFTGRTWVADRGIEISVTHPRVAKTSYVPTQVQDDKFRLTVFIVEYDEAPQLVWDMVIVKESRVSKSRVDIESQQWAMFLLVHAYDSASVTNGTVTTTMGAATHVGGGWWRVLVTSPFTQKVEVRVTHVESQYGISRFRHEAPPAEIIFDRVMFEVFAPARLNVGTAVGDKLKVRAYYQYDKTPFEGIYEVTPSPNMVVDRVAAVSYTVTQMVETKFGLTRFVSTTAVVRYDRIIVPRYTVDNNRMILEFVVNYESDATPLTAEVRIVAAGEVFATLVTTREGVGRFNYSLFLDRLARVSSVTIEPLRSLEHEVTVGVKTEVPVRLLQSVLTIDPKCQRNFVVRIEPVLTDGRLARVSAMLEAEALERVVTRLRTGESLELVLKPGINTVTLRELLVENTDMIVPNIRAFIGYRRAYRVALEMRLDLPRFQYTGYREAMLPGVVSLLNTGNVTLCDIQVVIVLERAGARREGRITVDLLQPGAEVQRSLIEFRIGTAYDVGLFNVTATVYYEPGLNILATRVTSITFVRELPAELEKLSRERDTLLGQMPDWDRRFFIEEVDKQIEQYNQTGTYDPAAVTDLLRRLEFVKNLITIYEGILRLKGYLETTYAEYGVCMGLQLLSDELNKTVDLWRQLLHAEAYQRMKLVYATIKLVHGRSSELAHACALAEPLPPEHGSYLASIIAEAIRLAMQNQTDLAIQRFDEAIRISRQMVEAWNALRLAEQAIRRAEAEGRTWGLDRARSLMSEARKLFDQKLYEDARQKALEAKEAADAATSPWTFILPVAVGVAVLAVAGYLIYRAVRIRRVLKG